MPAAHFDGNAFPGRAGRKVLNQFMEGDKKKGKKSMGSNEHQKSEEKSDPKVSKPQSNEKKKTTPRPKASDSDNLDDLIKITGSKPNLSGAKLQKVMASPEIAQNDSANENV